MRILKFKTFEEAEKEAARHTRCSIKRYRQYKKDGAGAYEDTWRVIIRNRSKVVT